MNEFQGDRHALVVRHHSRRRVKRIHKQRRDRNRSFHVGLRQRRQPPLTVRSSRQEYGTGAQAYLIRLRLVHERFIARAKHVVWRVVRRVHGEVPPGASWHGWQVKGGRLSAGIEHEIQRLVFAFVDQAGQLLFFRIRPVGQVPVWAEPLDLGVRVEMLLTQHRMGTTKGDHATGEAENFPMLFQPAPVMPARCVVLAVGIIVAALRAAEFVAAQ